MLDMPTITQRLARLEGWSLAGDTPARIEKTFRFANYYETLAFVNALAWIAHRADHHPDIEVGYNCCRVSYSTHDAGGLTDKDFDCATRVEALFAS